MRRPIFTALERDELPEGLNLDEQRLVAAFKQRLARLSTRLGEVGLERLIGVLESEEMRVKALNVGSSGGQGRPALYFELRHDGQPAVR